MNHRRQLLRSILTGRIDPPQRRAAKNPPAIQIVKHVTRYDPRIAVSLLDFVNDREFKISDVDLKSYQIRLINSIDRIASLRICEWPTIYYFNAS